MTKNWLNTDADFNELVNRIETYSGYSKSMRHPPAQVSMIICTLGNLTKNKKKSNVIITLLWPTVFCQ